MEAVQSTYLEEVRRSYSESLARLQIYVNVGAGVFG